MTKEQIKAEQIRLNQTYGFNLVPDGIMGPKTKAAMEKAVNMQDQMDLNKNYNAGLKVDGIWGPKSQAAYDAATAQHSAQIKNDIKVAETGQGYSQEEWDKAFNENLGVLNPSYQQELAYEKAGLASALEQGQADYGQYQEDQASKFEADKTALDQNAADQGVLFSGGRVQKEKKLGSSYANADKYKRDTYGREVGDNLRKFEYKYGGGSMNGLSDLYKTKSNIYNPNVATSGVSNSSLSSVYTQPNGGYYGTNNTKIKSEAAQRAYGQLGNVSNKNNPYGYLNKL